MSLGGSAKGGLRKAYQPDRRVRIASDVAAFCAVGLLIGVLGSAVTWWDRSPLFDLAESSRQVIKLGIGYLFGPLAILVALPLVFGRRRQVALQRWYRARLLAASVFWICGGIVLVDKVSGLDQVYTLEPGAYIAAALIVVGFLATLAMWPSGLREVEVDHAGRVQSAPAAG